MWEDLKVYKQLEKKDINPTFKKFGNTLLSLIDGYSINQASSIIKISRQINELEQAVFIEKDAGSYWFSVNTSIKPVDFYRRHKFTMVNIFSLGDIMNNHRRTSYPLTQEWNDLAVFLAKRISSDIEQYFHNLNSYGKIIAKRNEIEAGGKVLDNRYALLIYAAIRTKNIGLLNQYLDKKLSSPVIQITRSEYLKPGDSEIDTTAFLQRIKLFAQSQDFESMENEIAAVANGKNE